LPKQKPKIKVRNLLYYKKFMKIKFLIVVDVYVVFFNMLQVKPWANASVNITAEYFLLKLQRIKDSLKNVV